MAEQLRLRHATPADKEALAAFNVAAHARHDNPQSSAYLDRYTRDLFERPHPLIAVEDHLLPDCELHSDVARALLTALFPTQPSRLWTIV